MPKVVFVFGAGASADLDIPTMPTFMAAAHNLLRDRNEELTSPQAFQSVADFINASLDPVVARSKVDLDDVEAMFGLIEMGKLLGRLPGANSMSDIEQMSLAMRAVLADTVELTGTFSVNLDAGQFHTDFAYSHLLAGPSRLGKADIYLVSAVSKATLQTGWCH